MTFNMSSKTGSDDLNILGLDAVRVGGKYRLKAQIGTGTFGA